MATIQAYLDGHAGYWLSTACGTKMALIGGFWRAALLSGMPKASLIVDGFARTSLKAGRRKRRFNYLIRRWSARGKSKHELLENTIAAV
jgi:hypothetical protein